ncbi:DUF2871 domain-containing protein [Sporolactobacillus sp. THM19-2]|uniref:DUF2871 domain-containing protein n=1 Tax=Sporolactobacillus sp. THM19-2 TaxID=2511171 RepID=UPI00102007AF|nr:DUF2871 domain-containing protein [Sporolactobacillus sp. THM19-2]RYL93252.1 DUF2871 domain-containing protein [Sporolactobacillus sp. THM19-2]
MKRLYYTALGYMIAGLIAGIYYREVTKITGFTGKTMLSVLHTHLLVLGMFFFLILILLEKQFCLSKSKLFTAFYWIYNIGVIWTVALLAVHGTITAAGGLSGPAIAGIAGMGHIILSGGLILFFILLKERITQAK